MTRLKMDHRPISRTSGHPVVLELENHGDSDMEVWLEMVPEGVILAPGHRIQLLARPDEDLLPLDIARTPTGWVIHARAAWDPDWHVRFKGHVLKPASPSRLADFEDIEGDVTAMRYPLTKAELLLHGASASPLAS
jgi:hypothetical protein